jgi:hypothetical protein
MPKPLRGLGQMLRILCISFQKSPASAGGRPVVPAQIFANLTPLLLVEIENVKVIEVVDLIAGVVEAAEQDESAAVPYHAVPTARPRTSPKQHLASMPSQGGQRSGLKG